MNMKISSNVSPIKEKFATIAKGNLNTSNRSSITNNITQAHNCIFTFASIKQFINAKNNNYIDINEINQINIKNREYKTQKKDGKVEIIKSKKYRKFDFIKHFFEKCKADHFTSVKKDIKSMVDQKNHIKNITTPGTFYRQSAVTPMTFTPPAPVTLSTFSRTASVKPGEIGMSPMPPASYEPQKDTGFVE
ncbi:MAG: hypothetical protein EKE20_16855 [Candidatus Symbiopectobacterium sp. Dall1.0]|nr:hypothetical protein [Candidatus Symbiopectobacterium sp. Dall1.0]